MGKKDKKRDSRETSDISRIGEIVDSKNLPTEAKMSPRARPNFKKVTSLLDDIKDQSEAIEAETTAIEEDKKNLVDLVADWVKVRREVEALPQARREALGMRVERKLAEVNTEIESALGDPRPSVRAVAVRNYIHSMIETCPHRKKSVQYTLADFKQRGFVETDVSTTSTESVEAKERLLSGAKPKKGVPFEAYNEKLLLVAQCPKGPELVEELLKLVEQAREEGRETYEGLVDVLRQQATHRLDEIRAGESGQTFIFVPPGTKVRENRETGEEEVLRFPSGHLLFASDGRMVWPLAGVGGVQRDVERMKEHLDGVRIPLENLEDAEYRTEKRSDYFVLQLKFHSMVRRAIEQADKNKEARAVADRERQELLEDPRVDLEPEEYHLHKEVGVFLMDNGHGPWFRGNVPEGTDPRIFEVFALVERRRSSKAKDKLETGLVKYPARLKDFFKGCAGYYPEGEEPYPLKQLLQRNFTWVKSREDKAEAEAKTKEAATAEAGEE